MIHIKNVYGMPIKYVIEQYVQYFNCVLKAYLCYICICPKVRIYTKIKQSLSQSGRVLLEAFCFLDSLQWPYSQKKNIFKKNQNAIFFLILQKFCNLVKRDSRHLVKLENKWPYAFKYKSVWYGV